MFGICVANITRDADYIDTVDRGLYNMVLVGIVLNGNTRAGRGT